MAGTEVMALANDTSSDVHLNQALTPSVPHCQLAVGGADRVHLDTHTESNPRLFRRATAHGHSVVEPRMKFQDPESR